VSAIRTYLGAIAGHNAAKACSEMTSAAQQQLLSIAPKGAGSTCEVVVARISQLITGAEAKQVRDAKVVDVHVTGDTATAKIAGAGTTARLTDSGGRWQIAGGFGAP
jgi:hypothetical protein